MCAVCSHHVQSHLCHQPWDRSSPGSRQHQAAATVPDGPCARAQLRGPPGSWWACTLSSGGRCREVGPCPAPGLHFNPGFCTEPVRPVLASGANTVTRGTAELGHAFPGAPGPSGGTGGGFLQVPLLAACSPAQGPAGAACLPRPPRGWSWGSAAGGDLSCPYLGCFSSRLGSAGPTEAVPKPSRALLQELAGRPHCCPGGSFKVRGRRLLQLRSGCVLSLSGSRPATWFFF